MFFKDRKTVKDLIVRAGRGEAEAEFELAKRYMSGKGVKVDVLKAAELFEDSAKHGCMQAQLEAGDIYYNGIDDVLNGKLINRDYTKAAYYYEKAVENGAELTDDLCLQLGTVYRWGEYGIEEDPKKSVFWLLKPAENGNVTAQSMIAGCHYILEDKENALLWAKKAAERGGQDEMCSLGAMYQDFGDYENALIWYKKSAAMNDSFALFALGEMYLKGDGVEKDLKTAETYFRKSAELGYEEAEQALIQHFGKTN